MGVALFYYLSVSEICPDKRGGLWWEWPYFNISVYLKSVLIKGVASGGSGPIRGELLYSII